MAQRTPRDMMITAAIVATAAIALVIILTCVSRWKRQQETFMLPQSSLECASHADPPSAYAEYCTTQHTLDFGSDPTQRAAIEALNEEVLQGQSSRLTTAQARTICNLHQKLAGFVWKAPFIQQGNRMYASDVLFFRNEDMRLRKNTAEPHVMYIKKNRSTCRTYQYCPEAHTNMIGGTLKNTGTIVSKSHAQRVCDGRPACKGYVQSNDGTYRLFTKDARREDNVPNVITYTKSREDCTITPYTSDFMFHYQNYLNNKSASIPFYVDKVQRTNLKSAYGPDHRMLNRTCQSALAAGKQAEQRALAAGATQAEADAEASHARTHTRTIAQDCWLPKEELTRLKLPYDATLPKSQINRTYYVDKNHDVYKTNLEQCCKVLKLTARDMKCVKRMHIPNTTPNCSPNNIRTVDFFENGCNRMCKNQTAGTHTVYRKDIGACVRAQDKCKFPTDEACSSDTFRAACRTACTTKCTESQSPYSDCVSYDTLGSLYRIENYFTQLREMVDEDCKGNAYLIRGFTETGDATMQENTRVPIFKYEGFWVAEKFTTDPDGQKVFSYTFNSSTNSMEGGADLPNGTQNPWQGKLRFIHYDPFQKIVYARDAVNYNVNFRIEKCDVVKGYKPRVP